MKNTFLQKFLLIAAIGLFSQFTVAQDNAANAAAAKQIADIVASINHYPSDADKMALNAIIQDSSLSGGIHAMASAVVNIEHGANAEGKTAMAALQANAEAPDRAKALAGIIASLNHTASADAKAELAQLFP
jgi:DNA gyrase inhibitor GyrI